MNQDHSAQIELPRYECHKKVWALEIAGISADGELSFVDERYAPVLMDREWLDKHNPAQGGYYVVYEDGYKSYSPADVFEKGYTLISNE